MDKKSEKKEFSKEGLEKLAQILRNQNISLRKLVIELEQEKEENANYKIKDNNFK